MHAVLAAEIQEHPMVVGVLEVELDDVVVDVLHRALDAHARHVQLLELHEGHRPGGVLQERLVDAQGDRRAGLELAVGEVLFEDLSGEGVGHSRGRTREE